MPHSLFDESSTTRGKHLEVNLYTLTHSLPLVYLAGQQDKWSAFAGVNVSFARAPLVTHMKDLPYVCLIYRNLMRLLTTVTLREDQPADLPLFPHLRVKLGPLHGIWHLPAVMKLVGFFTSRSNKPEPSNTCQSNSPMVSLEELSDAVRHIWLHSSKMVWGTVFLEVQKNLLLLT